MKKVPFIANHGLYYDETAQLSHWHIPGKRTFLESWGDVKAHDSTASIVQPLISAALWRENKREKYSYDIHGKERKRHCHLRDRKKLLDRTASKSGDVSKERGAKAQLQRWYGNGKHTVGNS